MNGNFCVSWRGVHTSVPGDAYSGGRLYSRQAPQTWYTADGVPDMYFGPQNYDYAFRVITCEQAVPATPTTWGRLKTRYD